MNFIVNKKKANFVCQFTSKEAFFLYKNKMQMQAYASEKKIK